MSFIPQFPLSDARQIPLPTFEGPSHHPLRGSSTNNKVKAVALPSISELVSMFDIKQSRFHSPLPSFRTVSNFANNGYGQFSVDLTKDSPSCLVSEEASMGVDPSIGNVGGDARNYTESEGEKLNTQDVPHLGKKYKRSIYWKRQDDDLLTKAVLECFQENEGYFPKGLWKKVTEKVNGKNSLPTQVTPRQCMDRMQTLRNRLIGNPDIPPELQENITGSWSVVAKCAQFLLSQGNRNLSYGPHKKRKIEYVGRIGSLRFNASDATICRAILDHWRANKNFSWEEVETQMGPIIGITPAYRGEWKNRINYLRKALLKQEGIPEENKDCLKTNQWDEIARYILTCLDVEIQTSSTLTGSERKGSRIGFE